MGMNHQTAPVALREQVAVASGQIGAALQGLLQRPGVREAAVLSTCNRTEVYAAVDYGAEAAAGTWLAEVNGVSERQLADSIYRFEDAAAVRHLFRVATGLDSLILGEPQILGQVKQAWQQARDAGALGAPLDRLFQHSFAVAKRVRTDTRIGAHPVSVAFAAVRLAQQVFSELREATVLLIGAGETVELAARHLADHHARRLLFANRTLENAQPLAQRFGGYALALDDLKRHLPEADIVISATASREPILSRADVAQALRARRHRPMFLLDLAVPRDIEAEVASLDDVFLYTVDDLDQVIEDNRRSRLEAATEAEAIIELQVEHYLSWWRASNQQHLLKRLRARSEGDRDALLLRARQMLQQGRSADQALEYLANTLTNKLLHAPSANLRAAAMRGDLDLLKSAERIFDAPAAGAAAPLDKEDHEPEHPAQTRSTG